MQQSGHKFENLCKEDVRQTDALLIDKSSILANRRKLFLHFNLITFFSSRTWSIIKNEKLKFNQKIDIRQNFVFSFSYELVKCKNDPQNNYKNFRKYRNLKFCFDHMRNKNSGKRSIVQLWEPKNFRGVKKLPEARKFSRGKFSQD